MKSCVHEQTAFFSVLLCSLHFYIALREDNEKESQRAVGLNSLKGLIVKIYVVGRGRR